MTLKRRIIEPHPLPNKRPRIDKESDVPTKMIIDTAEK